MSKGKKPFGNAWKQIVILLKSALKKRCFFDESFYAACKKSFFDYSVKCR